MNRRQALTGLAATAIVTAVGVSERASAAPAGNPTSNDLFPTTIPLPDNWLPEGIAIGGGPFAYFGSRAHGGIYRANLITGEGHEFPQRPGTPSVGLKIDDHDRLFVAGGNAGNARVVSAQTGEILRSYAFVTSNTFVNDVVLTPHAAYFTESRRAVLYVLPLGPGGALPAVDAFVTLPLTGAIQIIPGETNVNGIARTPDGQGLLVIQSNTGKLFRVDPATGDTTAVDLHGENLLAGDGLLLHGTTLYVVENRFNRVAVLDVSTDGTSGTVLRRVGDSAFVVPTTVAEFGNRLYLPNAKFGAVPPATTFEAVSIPRP